ncbi:hypothetical protein NQZ68_010362 [Dissostichus eleginoides]|nr:hypothetical protein NQZ68_010362 [Dissostichus eleginoides]
MAPFRLQSAVRRPGSEPGPRPRPEATCWQGTEKPSESDGGQFPSHPGRPGPETSSEGAHLTPNPQEIQAGFTPLHPLPSLPLHPVIHPSIPPSLPASRRQKSPLPANTASWGLRKETGDARVSPTQEDRKKKAGSMKVHLRASFGAMTQVFSGVCNRV